LDKEDFLSYFCISSFCLTFQFGSLTHLNINYNFLQPAFFSLPEDRNETQLDVDFEALISLLFADEMLISLLFSDT